MIDWPVWREKMSAWLENGRVWPWGIAASLLVGILFGIALAGKAEQNKRARLVEALAVCNTHRTELSR